MLDQPLWTPSPIRVGQSNLARLMAKLKERHGVSLSSYADIHAFSVERPELFWEAVWEFGGVKASARGSKVFETADRIWNARFFPEARLNYAANLLVKNDDTPALIFRGEDKVRQSMSWRMLNDRVARLGQALKAYGIKPGDRVCAVVPNMPDTIAAFLATASVGAVWSSCSPDFGERGILDRFGQIAPRVLIANSNLVPKWADWEHFNELDRQGLMMYGQMTAGSWIYIGTQGILQGTYETLAECGTRHFGGSLKGTVTLTGGLGGMGGAQPLAVTMNDGRLARTACSDESGRDARGRRGGSSDGAGAGWHAFGPRAGPDREGLRPAGAPARAAHPGARRRICRAGRPEGPGGHGAVASARPASR